MLQQINRPIVTTQKEILRAIPILFARYTEGIVGCRMIPSDAGAEALCAAA